MKEGQNVKELCGGTVLQHTAGCTQCNCYFACRRKLCDINIQVFAFPSSWLCPHKVVTLASTYNNIHSRLIVTSTSCVSLLKRIKKKNLKRDEGNIY